MILKLNILNVLLVLLLVTSVAAPLSLVPKEAILFMIPNELGREYSGNNKHYSLGWDFLFGSEKEAGSIAHKIPVTIRTHLMKQELRLRVGYRQIRSFYFVGGGVIVPVPDYLNNIAFYPEVGIRACFKEGTEDCISLIYSFEKEIDNFSAYRHAARVSYNFY